MSLALKSHCLAGGSHVFLFPLAPKCIISNLKVSASRTALNRKQWLPGSQKMRTIKSSSVIPLFFFFLYSCFISRLQISETKAVHWNYSFCSLFVFCSTSLLVKVLIKRGAGKNNIAR